MPIIYITNKYSKKVTFLRKQFGMYRLSSNTTGKKVLQLEKQPTKLQNISSLFHTYFLTMIKSLSTHYSIAGCYCDLFVELFHTCFKFWSEMSN